MRVRFQFDWMLCLCLLAISLPGCGKGHYETTTLSGNFHIAGQPVEQGGLTFSPMESNRGKAVYVEVRDGRYSAENVPIGKVRVSFQAVKHTGQQVTVMGQASPEVKNIVPRNYRAGMTIDVQSDNPTHDFDLQDNAT